ncbi:MAG: hypothetical protein ACXVZV_08205 [Terriglobales bacterium]
MLDGKLSAREWADAQTIALGDVARLYVKENNRDVLLALEYLKADNFTVDLYLSNAAGHIYDLHSSAKLGERTLKDGYWPEGWNWWNNDRWTATVSRPDSFENRTFRDQKVREFQISRERFPGTTWKVYFEFMSPAAQPNWSTSRYPAKASNTSDEHWIALKLE